MVEVWPAIAVMTIAVLLGTVFGVRFIKALPEARFTAIVSILLIVLAAWLVVKA